MSAQPWINANKGASEACASRSTNPRVKGSIMKQAIDRLRGNNDDGMATVEYALVTVAAAAFAAVLIAIVKSPEVREALASLVGQALSGG